MLSSILAYKSLHEYPATAADRRARRRPQGYTVRLARRMLNAAFGEESRACPHGLIAFGGNSPI